MSSAVKWVIDPVHSSAEFSLQHMHVSTFRGRFATVQGEVLLDEEQPEASHVFAAIPVESLDVRDPELRKRLFDPEFFDVTKYPELTFESTRATRSGGSAWTVEGKLMIRGVTQPVTLNVEGLGTANHPFVGKPMTAFSARTEINRADFRMTWNAALDTGAPYLGERVVIALNVELIRHG